MSGRLGRRYQRLLFTYPSAYRRAHGEEMLGTLLEGARPDQRFPAPREAASLLLGGLRTRAIRRPGNRHSACGPTGCSLASS
jgi:hypothetical protein